VKRSEVRGAYVVTAALFAAVFADAVAEGLSNTSVFWHGRFTDQSSADLIPAFLIGLGALGLTLALIVLRGRREAGGTLRSLLLGSARFLTCREIARLVPVIFVAQIVALEIMETIEQVAVYGHALGGTLWLGAPILASLAIHALFCVGSAFVLSVVVRTLADGVRHLARTFAGWNVRLVRASSPRVLGGTKALFRVEPGVFF